MAKEENYTLSLIPLGEFSTGFIESGTYHIDKAVYAVRPLGKNKDRYALFVEMVLSGDSLAGPTPNRWFASFLTDSSGENLLMAPTEDGVHLAGPEGTTIKDYLAIANGDWEFTEDEPEEMYQGHLIGAVGSGDSAPPSVKLWRADWTQAWENFKKVMPDGVLVGDSLLPLEGYVLDFRTEPQAYGKKTDKTDKVYDVLVPVSLVSAPEKKKSSSTTASKAKTSTKTKTTTTPEPEDEGEEESNEEAQSQNEESEAVEAAIIEAITGKGPLTADKWLGKAVSLAPSKLKAKVAAYRNNKKWLFSSDRPWTSDAVKGTIEM